MQFKVGDKVKVLTDGGKFDQSGEFNEQGSIGEILHILEEPNEVSVYVRFNVTKNSWNLLDFWYDESELELVED